MSTKCRSVNDYATTRELHDALRELSRITDETNGDSGCSPPRSRRQSLERASSYMCVDDSPLDENWDWVLTNYDVGTTEPQSLSQELHRLSVLKSYLVLDSEREVAFDRLTTMAARIFNATIAVVSLVDLGRQFFLSAHGLGDVREAPRNVAFCAHAIQGRSRTFVVSDASKDTRFAENPLVTGAPHIRFYAGAPLLSPEGYKLGTFCIIDDKPRDIFSEQDEANLLDFAALAVQAIVERRTIASQDEISHMLGCTAHDLLTPLSGVQLSLSLLQDDQELQEVMSESHQESLLSAVRSSDWLHRICKTTIETLRAKSGSAKHGLSIAEDGDNESEDQHVNESPFIDMTDFVTNLNRTMEFTPKKVPLIFTIDQSVPSTIVCDDLKLFRSSLNLLSNAFSNTKSGSVHFRILSPNQEDLLFECTDTGCDLNLSEEEQACLFKPCKKELVVGTDLGLYSVAYHIESLGGSYGYRPRSEESEGKPGSVFWFQVPIVLPEAIMRGFPCAADKEQIKMKVCSLETTINHFAASLRTPRYRRASTFESLEMKRRGILAVAAAAAAAQSFKNPPSSCCNIGEKVKSLSDLDALVREKNPTRSPPGGSERLHYKNLSFTHTLAPSGISKGVKADNKSSGISTAVQTLWENIESTADREAAGTDTKGITREHETLNTAPLFPKASPGVPLFPLFKPKQEEMTSTAPDISTNVPCDQGAKTPAPKKVLIIEDTLVVLKTLTRALEKRGYEVTQAKDGLEGLEKLKETIYDFTLCDFLMPNMDGLGCVQQYRKWEQENRSWFQQHIVGISAHASENDVGKGIEIGMNDFRAKPITMKILEELEECLGVKLARSRRLQLRDTSAVKSVECIDGLDTNPTNKAPTRVCLMATARPTDESDKVKMESQGWRVAIVCNGHSALVHLKSRNWDVVLLDDDLPGLTGNECVEEFRYWEKNNRVNRQNNLFIVCTDILVSDLETKMHAPAGFDGAVNRQVLWRDLESLLGREQLHTRSLGREGLSILYR